MPPEEKKSESTLLKYPILSGSVLSVAVLAVFGFWLYVQTDSYVPDTLYGFFSHTLPNVPNSNSTTVSPLLNELPPPATDPGREQRAKKMLESLPPPSRTNKQPTTSTSPTPSSQATTSSGTTQSNPDTGNTFSPEQLRMLQMLPPPMSTK